ncbi:MAG: Ferredoxin, partial [bacterium 42_11]
MEERRRGKEVSSRVYFMDLRASSRENLLDKFERLLKTAHIGNLGLQDRFVAIKMHFGELGNLAYIRHNFVGRLVSILRSYGAKPFLTDTNTLYRGSRSDAISHLDTAFKNGFNPLTVGCQVLIADGLRGFDYREIEINLKHFSHAYIASAVAEADVIVSMNHFKGHELTGFGGAIKNIGMGCASREGKLKMHSTSKPIISEESCVSCGMCIRNCNYGAIGFGSSGKADINYEICTGCGQCIVVCPSEAIDIDWDMSLDACERIVEYAYAVLKNKPAFHVSFLTNVSPF